MPRKWKVAINKTTLTDQQVRVVGYKAGKAVVCPTLWNVFGKTGRFVCPCVFRVSS